MSDSRLNKLKPGIKNGTEVTLNISSNGTGDSSNKTDFPHKVLLTDTQFLRLRKAFTNNSLANIKLSKTKLSKMVQLGGFLPWGFSILKNPKKTSKSNGEKDRYYSAAVDLTDKIKEKNIR